MDFELNLPVNICLFLEDFLEETPLGNTSEYTKTS